MALAIKNETERVQKFLSLVADGVPMHSAGKQAGFSSPQRDAYRALYTPSGQTYIAHRIRQKITVEATPACYRVAMSLLEDTRVSPRVRWDIAKTLLAVGAGAVAPKAREADDLPADVGAMSGGELVALAKALQAESVRRSNAALVIEHEPAESMAFEPLDAQALDSLD